MPTQVKTQEEEFKTWRAEGHALTIEYAASVIEELRQAAEQGYQKIPHGGIEIGAVLFGDHDGSTIRIREWRPMACEHARGPSFNLSEKDCASLRQLLDTCAIELPGLEPVGWFHTHTRSKIFLSPDDVAIYDRFFPEPWQISMVMRLQKEAPATAGFFFREPELPLQTESSFLEFTIRPDPFALTRARRPTAATARPEAPVRPTPPRPSADSAPRETPTAVAPADLPGLVSAPTSLQRRPPVLVPMAAADDSVPIPDTMAGYPNVPNPNRSFRRRIVFLMMFVALLAGAVIITRWYWVRQPPAAVGLRLEEAGDQLIIHWDHNAYPIRMADAGLLSIRDGQESREIRLDPIGIRRGSVTYVRAHEDVEVRLTVSELGKVTAQEFTRYLGRPPAAPNGAASPEADAERLRADSERLRQALADEYKRNRELVQSVRSLEQRLRKQ